jgi:hypothetical protein
MNACEELCGSRIAPVVGSAQRPAFAEYREDIAEEREKN